MLNNLNSFVINQIFTTKRLYINNKLEYYNNYLEVKELMTYMNNKANDIMNFIRQNKKTITIVFAIIIATATVIFLGFKIGQTFAGKNNPENQGKEVSGNETRESTKDIDDGDKSIDSQNLEDDDKDNIYVEKAPLDDIGDPQNNSSSGASIDIRDIAKAEGENDNNTYGIDVAKWQGIIDWKQVKDSGVEFAMIRVGYRTLDKGVIQEDPYAEYNLQQAEANGIKIGVYFFSTAISKEEAIEEANWVSQFIGPYPITYPVVYNCENFTSPNNRQYNLSIEDRSNFAITFLDQIQTKGYTPMFYAAKSELENNSQWNTSELSSKYKIWVAHYPGNFTITSKSSYSGVHEMWQYTSNGLVAGINNSVDLNVAYFGFEKEAKAKDDTPRDIVSPDPGALVNFQTVDEQVTAKNETNLRNLPSTSGSEVVGILKNGDITKRTGIGDNGWSQIIYNGMNVYARSSLLTSDLNYTSISNNPNIINGQNFTNVDEQVTAKEVVNLRSLPSSQGSDLVKGQLNNGEVARRTGQGDKGWSRLEIDGQIYYVISNYITTDLNYQKPITQTQESQGTTIATPSLDNPEAGMSFVAVNEQVTAKEMTNLRLVPTTSIDTVDHQLLNGEIAVRTGVDQAKGWSRVVYNDKVLYGVTDYLVVVE